VTEGLDECGDQVWREKSFVGALGDRVADILGDMVLPLCGMESSTDVCTWRAVPSDRFCFFRVGANSQGSLSRLHRLHGGSAGASTPDNVVSHVGVT